MSDALYRPNWMSALSARDYSPIKDDTDNCRTAFQKDVGIILHSNVFKRLAHKTQVHSLPANDHVRTRLTHSLEVSQIGRQIARKFCETLIRAKCFEKEDDYYRFVSDLQELTSAACLSHDIGHGPFGHVGKVVLSSRSPEHHRFDDNKQVVRILLNPMYGDDLKTTAPLIASVLKKFDLGKVCYEAELNKVQEIMKHLGLEGEVRHPVSFFMEAADDIAYIAADLMDYLTYYRNERTTDTDDYKKLVELLHKIPDVDSKKTLGNLFAEAKNFSTFKKFSDAVLRAGLHHVLLSFTILGGDGAIKIEDIPKKYSDFVKGNAHKYFEEGEPKTDFNPLYLGIGSNNIGSTFYAIKDIAYNKMILKERHISAQNLQAMEVINGLWDSFERHFIKDAKKLQKTMMESLIGIMPLEVHQQVIDHIESGAKQEAIVDLIACMTDRYASEFWETLRSPIRFRVAA